ncbi:claudin-23-like [Acipenser ruthenus]|nr:claudin-23-like [Acipenser ruthenus]
MRTPAPMIAGIVCTPIGMIFVFTALITPQWREGHIQLGKSPSIKHDGLWESCIKVVASDFKHCWPVSGAYQQDPSVLWAGGLMLSSLSLCGVGIVLASIGIRCWMDFPLRNVAGASGIIIILSGCLSLTALGLYISKMQVLGTDLDTRYRGGTSLYFGWIGSSIEILGGMALSLSFSLPKCNICIGSRNKDKNSYEVNS